MISFLSISKGEICLWSSIVAWVQHNSWCKDTGQKHSTGYLLTLCTRLYTEIQIWFLKKAIVMGRLLHLHLGNVPSFPSAQRENRNETMRIYEKLKLNTGKFSIYTSQICSPLGIVCDRLIVPMSWCNLWSVIKKGFLFTLMKCTDW